MTEALFLEVCAKEVQLREEGVRRLNVSGVLKILGVSRSSYLSFIRRLPLEQKKTKERIKQKIEKIYRESHQNYGAPKITRKQLREGKKIL